MLLCNINKTFLTKTGENELMAQSVTGRVIPAGATVFGMAVESAEIRRHHRWAAPAVNGLTNKSLGFCSKQQKPNN